MIRDMLTACALVVSVTGIGVSLAREEMRCYLGLQSAECGSTEIQSPSPSSVEKNTTSNPETSSSDSEFNNNKAITKTTKPFYSQPEDSNNSSSVESGSNSNSSETTENNPIDSVSPVEEVSRTQPLPVQPFVEENNPSDTSTTPENSSPTEDKSFGIPIKVEPFPESE